LVPLGETLVGGVTTVTGSLPVTLLQWWFTPEAQTPGFKEMPGLPDSPQLDAAAEDPEITSARMG
jgi:hypothetical protein